MTRLLHGGRLQEAARHYGRPAEDWLDLSCALNPEAWPVPRLPPEVFARLPEEDDGLTEAAAGFYGTRDLLMLPGTQAAIATLPNVMPGIRRVWVPACGYEEHAHCWSREGHQLSRYNVLPEADQLTAGDVLVTIRPNNPLGSCSPLDQLRALHARLCELDGLLVADEAFMDATPDQSLIEQHMPEHLVILRSFGKFFGLAGLRLGCMVASTAWRARIEGHLEPWCINNPARFIARQAYADARWHAQARQRLPEAADRLSSLMRDRLALTAGQVSGCALFVTLHLGAQRARQVHDGLAKEAILVRLFADEGLVRLGLPANAAETERLRDALTAIAAPQG